MSDPSIKLLDDKDEFELDDRDEFFQDVQELYFHTKEDARRCSHRFMTNFWHVTINETLDIMARPMWVLRASR